MTKLMRLGTAAVAVAASLAAAAPASAQLIIEPLITFVPGSGPSDTSVPLYNPDFLNGRTGLPFLTADEPGEIVTYPAGFPVDPVLRDVISIYNNTSYDITGFTFSLVGTADEDPPFSFDIFRDPNVNAFFGDANGDGQVGFSDIFSQIEVSNGGRTITLTGGVIPRGGRFVDSNFAITLDGQPFLAAIDASFIGTYVPEPATWAMMVLGFGLGGAALRRRRSAGGLAAA